MPQPDQKLQQTSTQQEVRCHRCSQYIGESDGPMELVGVVRDSDLVQAIAKPRRVWRCRCQWMNVFRPIAKAS